MNCPQCRVPMTALKKAGFLSRLVSSFFGSPEGGPAFRCPKCYSEVSTPLGNTFVLYIENLEDYRKSCLTQLSHLQSEKGVLGGFWMQFQEDRLARLKRDLRILEAMTPEERLQPDLLGAEARQRIVAASDTTPDDVEQLFKEFRETRDFYTDFRSKTFRRQMPPWYHLARVCSAFGCSRCQCVGAIQPDRRCCLELPGLLPALTCGRVPVSDSVQTGEESCVWLVVAQVSVCARDSRRDGCRPVSIAPPFCCGDRDRTHPSLTGLRCCVGGNDQRNVGGFNRASVASASATTTHGSTCCSRAERIATQPVGAR